MGRESKKVLKEGWKKAERLFKSYLKCDEDDKEKDEKSESFSSLQTLNVSEGQVIENPVPEVVQHWTSPPKQYTEDTLLSAMETAGNADYDPDSDVEKKGLGTPATRANIIETLLKRGYVERKKKNITATEKGVNLIKTVPETVKSAKLTADWETELQKIAKGEANADTFMMNITNYVTRLIGDNSTANADTAQSFSQPREQTVVGKCPKCGKDVTETPKAYSCCGGRDGCGFMVWKSQFFKENALTVAQAKKLLEKRKTDKIKGFVSKKTGKPYDAFIVLKDDFTTGMEF